jgi:starch synthase
MGRKRLNILYAAAEALPFAKVGGLADVAGALPKALARRGHRVTLLLPGYRCVGQGETVHSLAVALGDLVEPIEVQAHGSHDGVDVYTIENEGHFGRELIYGYPDDDLRFLLFSKAVVGLAALPDWTPDILHVNDWHLGLVPECARETPYRSALRDTSTVLTIHNLAYQGPLTPKAQGVIGGVASLLARGIAAADAINTVSRSYLEEILKPEHGMGLDELLGTRRDRLWGILNGIDYSEFDPRSDPYIVARYDQRSLERKRLNKGALQEESGLALNPELPLLGMVARMVDQKGVDLLIASLQKILRLGLQVVVMGLGEDSYREALERAAERHAEAMAYHPVDDEALARLVYAGSDFFLAPSAYEPCGLGPLIALRYGSIPIVRSTGGLAETIRNYYDNPRAGLGFTFVRKYPQSLARTVARAVCVYAQKDRWRELQRRAMRAVFSWERAAREYEQMYLEARSRQGALQSGEAVPLVAGMERS